VAPSALHFEQRNRLFERFVRRVEIVSQCKALAERRECNAAIDRCVVPCQFDRAFCKLHRHVSLLPQYGDARALRHDLEEILSCWGASQELLCLVEMLLGGVCVVPRKRDVRGEDVSAGEVEGVVGGL
jgi:hypothetical protein